MLLWLRLHQFRRLKWFNNFVCDGAGGVNHAMDNWRLLEGICTNAARKSNQAVRYLSVKMGKVIAQCYGIVRYRRAVDQAGPERRTAQQAPQPAFQLGAGGAG